MEPRLPRVALVACAKKKKQLAAAAGDLYQSELFRRCRAFAVANSDEWFILSAEYGLLQPQRVIERYDCTLNSMSKIERHAWADKVQKQLREWLPAVAEVIILAGMRYREGIEPFLIADGYRVSVPMRGLGIGKQLQWLQRRAN
jgi:cytoplasmic iron level regulating protein YaaA (DUF328/UPF0246 family)